MDMNQEEKDAVRSGLDAFFKGAGLSGWRGEVNTEVAVVFHAMLCQARRCSSAMHWVPRPGLNPGVSWFAKNLTRSIKESPQKGNYRICQLEVVRKYRTARDLAEQGIGGLGMPVCKN